MGPWLLNRKLKSSAGNSASRLGKLGLECLGSPHFAGRYGWTWSPPLLLSAVVLLQGRAIVAAIEKKCGYLSWRAGYRLPGSTEVGNSRPSTPAWHSAPFPSAESFWLSVLALWTCHFVASKSPRAECWAYFGFSFDFWASFLSDQCFPSYSAELHAHFSEKLSGIYLFSQFNDSC